MNGALYLVVLGGLAWGKGPLWLTNASHEASSSRSADIIFHASHQPETSIERKVTPMLNIFLLRSTKKEHRKLGRSMVDYWLGHKIIWENITSRYLI